ncbi:uncharacterized protein VTP21DRAFT_1801 [Calcarisporiella thermophila]|uniref:uncharacterized protein n=1 Tax=Calcarisporiella thermophila TaxID=911321 RepID=UPI0037426895
MIPDGQRDTLSREELLAAARRKLRNFQRRRSSIITDTPPELTDVDVQRFLRRSYSFQQRPPANGDEECKLRRTSSEYRHRSTSASSSGSSNITSNARTSICSLTSGDTLGTIPESNYDSSDGYPKIRTPESKHKEKHYKRLSLPPPSRSKTEPAHSPSTATANGLDFKALLHKYGLYSDSSAPCDPPPPSTPSIDHSSKRLSLSSLDNSIGNPFIWVKQSNRLLREREQLRDELEESRRAALELDKINQNLNLQIQELQLQKLDLKRERDHWFAEASRLLNQLRRMADVNYGHEDKPNGLREMPAWAEYSLAKWPPSEEDG